VVIAAADAGQFAFWSVAMDGMTVNGQNVTLPPSAVDPKNTSQFVVILDTGNSHATVPEYVFTNPWCKWILTTHIRDVFDAIYGDVEGAVQDSDGTAAFPCDAEVNITFTFGGQVFPVHPLDDLLDTGREDGLCEPQVCQLYTSKQSLADDVFSSGRAAAASSLMQYSVCSYLHAL
jgi:hypothetical protein